MSLLYKFQTLFRPEKCPYCFQQFLLRKAELRCTNKKCTGQAVDRIRADRWEDTTRMGKVLPSPGVFAKQGTCDACGRHTYRRICPRCHVELPASVGQCPNRIFAVIGAKEAGKSHYIAVLINELIKRVCPPMHVSMEPLDDQTMTRYRDQFYDPLICKLQLLEATKSGLVSNPFPLVYSLKQSGTNVLGQPVIRRTTTLVFFDTAGEDLNSDDTMSSVSNYIGWADGIIVLLDPLQLPTVRNQLGMKPDDSPQINTETTDILTRTSKLIRNVRGLADDSIIKVPLAVAFSKFDAVQRLVDPQMQLNRSPNHQGGFDVEDAAAVNDEMQSLLVSWDGEGLISQATTSFRYVNFFGLSALGESPIGTKVPRILPHRVAEPFLWMLHHHGFLAGKKGEEA